MSTSTSSTNLSDYDFIPLPLQQTQTNQKIVIQPDPNSPGGKNMSNIQQNMAQSNANTQFDTVNTNVKPLNGGKKNKNKINKYTIEFKNKKFIVKDLNMKKESSDKIIKNFLKEQNFKNDHLISFYDHQTKNKSLYHVKDTKNIKIRKLY